MRTAEDIYESNVQYERNDVSESLKASILGAIITAQKEAIEECAKVAKTTSNCKVWNCEGESVDKELILNLIKHLK